MSRILLPALDESAWRQELRAAVERAYDEHSRSIHLQAEALLPTLHGATLQRLPWWNDAAALGVVTDLLSRDPGALTDRAALSLDVTVPPPLRSLRGPALRAALNDLRLTSITVRPVDLISVSPTAEEH